MSLARWTIELGSDVLEHARSNTSVLEEAEEVAMGWMPQIDMRTRDCKLLLGGDLTLATHEESPSLLSSASITYRFSRIVGDYFRIGFMISFSQGVVVIVKVEFVVKVAMVLLVVPMV